MTEPVTVSVTVNGLRRSALVEPRTLLVDFLRHELSLTGTHVGCEQGVCGACTVRVDGALARSCLLFAVQVEGAEIATVEGMASSDAMHPIQEAFHREHALQCGFCTPGFLLSVQQLLERNPDPTEEEVRDFLSGNVCRCTGYDGIIAATMLAARLMSEQGGSVRPSAGPA